MVGSAEATSGDAASNMASQPIPQPGAAPGGAAPPAPQPGGAPGGGAQNPLMILAALTRLAQMLAQSSPSAAQDAQEIIKNVQNAARKLTPQQPDNRQQSPF